MKLSLGLILAFAMYMCEPADHSASTCTRSGDSGSDSGDGLVCGEHYDLSENGGPSLFATKIIQYTHVNAAGLVETDTISELLALLEFHVDEPQPYVRMKLCTLEIPAVQVPGQPAPTKFTILPELLPNVESVEAPLSIEGDTTCSTISFPPLYTVIGARLINDATDPLPHDPNASCPDGGVQVHQASCVYDVDKDGEVGATLIAENVPGLEVTQAYVIMRSWTSMEGMVANSDLILGTADWDLDQFVLSCKVIPVGSTQPRYCNDEEISMVRTINPEVSQSSAQPSTYMAVRVSPDMDCEQLIEQADELFGR